MWARAPLGGLGLHPPNVDSLGVAFQPRGAVDELVEPRPWQGSSFWSLVCSDIAGLRDLTITIVLQQQQSKE